MIVTIDGPAGSGKSTTARAVAHQLGFRHLDSGAFYRALTFAALRAHIDPERWPELTLDELEALAVTARPDEHGFLMTVHGQDVSRDIRSPEVNAQVSHMARVPAVRQWLLERLHTAGRDADLVTDGRDMGTVVFPDAELKIFLVCAPDVRARRRLAEIGTTDPTAGDVEVELGRLLERDRMDSERAIAPLRRAPDAVELDTTGLTFDEQVARIVSLARQRMKRTKRTASG